MATLETQYKEYLKGTGNKFLSFDQWKKELEEEMTVALKLQKKQITEDYVSFETAKLLKEKRFDIPTHTYYEYIDQKVYYQRDRCCELKPMKNRNEYLGYASRPTQSLVVKWLRIKHGIDVTIMIRFADSYSAVIHKDRKYETELIIEPTWENRGKMYEEATEAAIQYALKNLVK